ncbi:MAG: hypothetical protein AB9866_07980 [Syntrophobacteraceae bacterium]
MNRSLSGYWKRIAMIAGGGTVAGALTFGLAAPFMGVLIGHSMGLAGAAVIKAGLAALASGAVASGGMGIAGGTAVILGGGALLGIEVSGSAAAANPVGILIQAAKIEVFFDASSPDTKMQDKSSKMSSPSSKPRSREWMKSSKTPASILVLRVVALPNERRLSILSGHA